MQKDVETLTALGEAIKATLGSAVHSADVAFGELTLRAETSNTIRVLTTLRDDPRFLFKNSTDLTAADYPAARNALILSGIFCRQSTTHACA